MTTDDILTRACAALADSMHPEYADELRRKYDDTYNGWTNRETWAVALHINNDQGWQESAHEAITADVARAHVEVYTARMAGEIIRENVEETLSPLEIDLDDNTVALTQGQLMALHEIGSMWRVNWDELGASFLSDLDEN